MSMQFFLTL